MSNDFLFDAIARSFEARREAEMSLAEYLESCRGDPMRYATAAERLLAAIGEPQMTDTAKESRRTGYRMLQEEAQHLPRGVRPSLISVRVAGLPPDQACPAP